MVLPMAKLLSSPRPYVAVSATIALGDFGGRAKAAFPEIARSLARPMLNAESFRLPGADDINPAAAMALAQIDDERAREHLKRALGRGRITAAEALFALGKEGTAAIREVLADARNATAALNAIAAFLFYPDPLHFYASAKDIAESIAPLEGMIEDLAGNEDLAAETRRQAAYLIATLTPPPAKLLALVSRWAMSRDETLRGAAETLQSKLRYPDALAAVLRESSDDEESSWRHFDRYQMVAKFGDKASAAVRKLRSLVEQEKEPMAVFAVWALGSIPTEDSRKVLIKALESWNWRVVMVAANSLGRLTGPPAVAAREPLEEIARAHWHPGVREHAGKTLEFVIGRSKPVEPIPEYEVDRLEFGYDILADDWICDGVRSWQDVMPPAPKHSEAPVPKPVHKVSDGWLVVADTPDFEREHLQFSAAPSQPGAVIATGEFAAILGTSTEAFVLEIEKIRSSDSFWSRVLRVRRLNGKWLAEAFAELPIGAKPKGRTQDGALIVGSKWGDVRIDANGSIATGPCIERFPTQRLGGELVQKLLDDGGFRSLLTKRKVPIPLPLSWQHHDSDGLVFQRKPVHVVDNVVGPDLGRELRIGQMKTYSTTTASVSFSYWDLGIEGTATFDKGSSGWHVKELSLRRP
jgi:hypothetical protein